MELKTATAAPGRTAAPAVADALPALRSVAGWPAWRIEMACGVAGAVLAGAAAGLLYRLAEPGQALHRMFDPSRAETLVPWAILASFFYGTLYLVHRARRLAALRKVAHRGAAVALVDALGRRGAGALCAHLEASPCTGNPLWRRALAVLRQWQLQPGLAEAELALDHQVQADQDTLHRAHAALGTIVWALPVLGLIGTVLGIANAVDGFSGFLSGDIDDIRSIKRSLVAVTGGLSFAFLLTLVGLVTSLLLMFHNAAVQSREERFLDELQDWLCDLLLPALQRAQPAAAAPQADAPHALAALGEQWRAELARGSDLMIEAFARELAVERGAVAKATTETVSGLLESTRAAGAGLQQAAQLTRELVDAVRAGVALDREALDAIRATQLGPALLQVAEQVRVQREQALQAEQTFAALTQATRVLADCHAGVQSGIRALDGMQLPGALGDLGAALGRLRPVLEQFQRPFLLTAVPVSGQLQAAAVAGAGS